MYRWRKVLGVAVIICSICLIFTWERYGKEKVLYKQIAVLKENVNRGEIIRKDMIKFLSISLREPCITKSDSNKLIGKMARHYIHKGTPLFDEYFEDEADALDYEKGKMIMSIPDNLIANRMANFERGDTLSWFIRGESLGSCRVYNFYKKEKRIEILAREDVIKKLSVAIYQGGRLVAVKVSD